MLLPRQSLGSSPSRPTFYIRSTMLNLKDITKMLEGLDFQQMNDNMAQMNEKLSEVTNSLSELVELMKEVIEALDNEV